MFSRVQDNEDFIAWNAFFKNRFKADFEML